MEHATNQPAMLYHLAFCEAKLGETAAARATLQKALGSKSKFTERDAAQKLLDSLPPGKEIVSSPATGWETRPRAGSPGSEAGERRVFCLSSLTVSLPEPMTPGGHLCVVTPIIRFSGKETPMVDAATIPLYGVILAGG